MASKILLDRLRATAVLCLGPLALGACVLTWWSSDAQHLARSIASSEASGAAVVPLGWEDLVLRAVATALGLWGVYWTLACLAGCLLATLERRRAARPSPRRGRGPAAQADPTLQRWGRLIPRRALGAAGLVCGLWFSSMTPAAAAAPHAGQTLTRAVSDSSHGCLPAPGPHRGQSNDPTDAEAKMPGYTIGGNGASFPPIWGAGQRLANEVVVRPGDSLWRIASRHLGPHATSVDIDREWRLWYRHNLAVIGPDPHLLLPGQRLRAPG